MLVYCKNLQNINLYLHWFRPLRRLAEPLINVVASLTRHFPQTNPRGLSGWICRKHLTAWTRTFHARHCCGMGSSNMWYRSSKRVLENNWVKLSAHPLLVTCVLIQVVCGGDVYSAPKCSVLFCNGHIGLETCHA